MGVEFKVTKKRIVLFGASRGLGAAVHEALLALPVEHEFLLVSRGRSRLAGNWLEVNLADPEVMPVLLQALHDFRPQLAWCFVGGGPYGDFAGKTWRDHQWAWRLTFEFPARVLHWALTHAVQWQVEQVVMTGSAVAESSADPFAASYAAAKHALVGLHHSVVGENPPFDIRLFSPGYMDTQMLPPRAAARSQPVWSPSAIAADFLQWVAEGPDFDHRRLAVRPGPG